METKAQDIKQTCETCSKVLKTKFGSLFCGDGNAHKYIEHKNTRDHLGLTDKNFYCKLYEQQSSF